MCHSMIELPTRRELIAARTTPPRRRIRVPRLVTAAFSGLLSLFATSHAAADSATGNQDPDYTVAISLASSGQDANTAAPGDTVTATLSVTNNTASFKSAGATVSVTSPTGFSLTGGIDAPMVPRQTVTQKLDFKVPANLPAGSYQWVLTAGDAASTTRGPGPKPGFSPALMLVPTTQNSGNPEPPDPTKPGPGKPVNPGKPVAASSATATITIT